VSSLVVKASMVVPRSLVFVVWRLLFRAGGSCTNLKKRGCPERDP
jgi:hypothetical protein